MWIYNPAAEENEATDVTEGRNRFTDGLNQALKYNAIYRLLNWFQPSD